MAALERDEEGGEGLCQVVGEGGVVGEEDLVVRMGDGVRWWVGEGLAGWVGPTREGGVWLALQSIGTGGRGAWGDKNAYTGADPVNRGSSCFMASEWQSGVPPPVCMGACLSLPPSPCRLPRCLLQPALLESRPVPPPALSPAPTGPGLL